MQLEFIFSIFVSYFFPYIFLFFRFVFLNLLFVESVKIFHLLSDFVALAVAFVAACYCWLLVLSRAVLPVARCRLFSSPPPPRPLVHLTIRLLSLVCATVGSYYF